MVTILLVRPLASFGTNASDTCVLPWSMTWYEYAVGVANLLIATEIDNCRICLKAKLLKVN
jgi:hypothetical protein